MKIKCTMPARLLLLCSLAWLWFTLINHLRVEWSVNPQYAYGWAVPFLCLYLLWGRLKDHRTTRPQDHTTAGVPSSSSPVISGPVVSSPCFSFSAFQLFSICLLAFLCLPTRLVQEANPEWRLVSWALAFEVIGLTLLTLRMTGDGRRKTGGEGENAETLKAEMLKSSTHKAEARGPQPVVRGPVVRSPVVRSSVVSSPCCGFSDFVFPICFFLVAVPWPTFIEGPLVQGLMRANVGATIELLALTGVPAIQHGNVIEIANGVVGIDDACSGIRSLQAALMLSLFFGEVYRLAVRRRLMLVVLGFLLAFAFNVGRTLLLTQVAAAKGIGAVATWHDPAGVTILVACFLCLWLMAKGLRGKAEMLKAETLKSGGQRTEDGGQRMEDRGQRTEDRGQWSAISSPVVSSQPSVVSGPGFSVSAFQYFSIFLTFWLILVEAGTELWYRSHEWGVPKTATWRVEFPRNNPTFRDLPLSDKTKQFLRYDEGCNGVWQPGDGQKWQAIFLRWNPGRIAVHLAKSHTPEVCLTAAGRDLVSQSGLRPVRAHGLELPFRSYVVKDESGPLHVFYCLWEDRANAQSFRTTRMSYANRLAPVLAGRRNSGQRSLEVAIWGIADQNEADAALARELEKLIHVEN
jgi:exosortase/archaeosortase family protein